MVIGQFDEESKKVMSVGFSVGLGLSMVVLSLSVLVLSLKDVHLTIELKRDKEAE